MGKGSAKLWISEPRPEPSAGARSAGPRRESCRRLCFTTRPRGPGHAQSQTTEAVCLAAWPRRQELCCDSAHTWRTTDARRSTRYASRRRLQQPAVSQLQAVDPGCLYYNFRGASTGQASRSRSRCTLLTSKKAFHTSARVVSGDV